MFPDQKVLRERIGRRYECPRCGSLPGNSCYQTIGPRSFPSLAAVFPKQAVLVHEERMDPYSYKSVARQMAEYEAVAASEMKEKKVAKATENLAIFWRSIYQMNTRAVEQIERKARAVERKARAAQLMSPEAVFWRKFRQMNTRAAKQSERKIRAAQLMSPEAVFWRKFRQMNTRGVPRKVAKFSTQEEAATFAKMHFDTYLFPHKFVRNSHKVDENGKNVYSRTYYYKVLYR